MSSAMDHEQIVLPPKLPLAGLSLLTRQSAARLVTPSGEQLDLPAEIFQVLHAAALAMQANQAVTVKPLHQRLTTQEAADLIGVPHPVLVKYLEQDRLPYDRTDRHRPILLTDVLAFRKEQSLQRSEALENMVEIADEAGMYNDDDFPTKTR